MERNRILGKYDPNQIKFILIIINKSLVKNENYCLP